MLHRRGRISLFTLLLFLGIGVGVVGTNRFGPYYWDYWQMKEITKSTARTWRVLGRKAADEKLSTMIEDRGLSDYIDPSFCDIHEVASGYRVQCSWEVDVYYPFSDTIRVLSFETEYIAHMDG
jgi:hypothetical protein